MAEEFLDKKYPASNAKCQIVKYVTASSQPFAAKPKPDTASSSAEKKLKKNADEPKAHRHLLTSIRSD